MPGFFMKAKSGQKRPLSQRKTAAKPKKLSKEIESDDEESDISGDEEIISGESETEDETAQEKRLRIAKEYINRIQQEELEKEEEKDFGKDAIAHRLQQDVDEDAGRLQKFIANQVSPQTESLVFLKGHKLSITNIVVSSDNKYIFSASKDGIIIKWKRNFTRRRCQKSGNLANGNKIGKIVPYLKNDKTSNPNHHTGQVLCLALSSDGKYLASSGNDKLVYIWNPDTLEHLHTFKGHRNTVSSLAFQLRTHQLFSASHDKTIKVWSLDEMAYVETLFGHEDSVLGVSSLIRDRVVSCGGRDRSVRLWKIPEESQLVFQSTKGSSFDCVTMLNDEYFLTGGDDNSLSIFHVRKKKPITLRTNAHKGISSDKTLTSTTCNESWITAVASVPFTDLVATGSCDGCIKLWRCEKSFRSIMPIHSIEVDGFVNSLQFSSDGKYLIAGVAQEHRLGRWWKIKSAKNTVCIIPLIYTEDKT